MQQIRGITNRAPAQLGHGDHGSGVNVDHRFTGHCGDRTTHGGERPNTSRQRSRIVMGQRQHRHLHRTSQKRCTVEKGSRRAILAVVQIALGIDDHDVAARQCLSRGVECSSGLGPTTCHRNAPRPLHHLGHSGYPPHDIGDEEPDPRLARAARLQREEGQTQTVHRSRNGDRVDHG
jgi:hypothetical protein